jgi:phosphatidylcholine synthase
MFATILIDGTDGSFARRLNVAKRVPRIDGALLDNLMDFINYVVTPCFFLVMSPLLPTGARWPIVAGIAMSSAYQFAQTDAKTKDNFFKGFPSYWNIVVYFLFIFDSSPPVNAAVLSLLSVLVFVPIKYVYPSRMDHVSKSKTVRVLLFLATALFGVASCYSLWIYPQASLTAHAYSLGYVVLYMIVSLYCTMRREPSATLR